MKKQGTLKREDFVDQKLWLSEKGYLKKKGCRMFFLG